ncbi:unnamed protein product [Ranitomeya imitator]|uniref:EGF-like domain-containing protein n=1 Tax=Ranitomeya imitator TaxID=111125 RepID=A0ABN9KU29_9NEOB|nr:unnamed protein product [Ranitomeya imitator]
MLRGSQRTLLEGRYEWQLQHEMQGTVLISSAVSCMLRVVPSRHTGGTRVPHVCHTDGLPQSCLSNQFQCANGDCVPRDFICDHDDDCGDGSDEKNCSYPTCKGDYFTCPSGRCIHQSWLCDGDDDCDDNADETGCESGLRECGPGEWPCPSSGQCIPIDKVCDGTAHCRFGEDETNTTAGRNCSTTNCAALSCSYQCHSSPSGGVCFCPAGYVISANDSRTCIDFNDCQIWGICDQLCEDRMGSHRCSCVDGYVLEHNKHCRANTTNLLIGDIHGNSYRTLVHSQNRGIAVGVDFHFHLRRVFWTDTVQDKVFYIT